MSAAPELSSFLDKSAGEVKKALPVLRKGEKAVVAEALGLVLADLAAGGGGAAAASPAHADDDTAQGALYQALFVIVRAALRNRTKKEQLVAYLDELKIPQATAVTIAAAVDKQRLVLEEAQKASTVSLPRIKDVKWRVDVTISTSALTRVLTPCVHMQLTLDDGSIKTFLVSHDQFNVLRYNVAKALKEVQDVTRQPILKVDART